MRVAALALPLLVAAGARGQFVQGHVDLAVAAPHNEIDLGLCTLARSNPYPNTTCSAYARYSLSGYLELRPLSHTPLRHLFGIFEPKLYGGNNIPEVRYTASAAPILWESTVGAGYDMPRHFQLRYTHHVANLLGRYTGLGAAPVRPDGPYGKNSTMGLRWYFGGADHPAAQAQSVSLHGVAEMRGFLDFEVAPPHYEVDLGLCTPIAALPAGPGCGAYARYVASGQLSIRPLAGGGLRRLSLFFEPNLFAGNNIPQLRYNGSPALILWEFQAGAALALPRRFELRFTHHEVAPLGRYGGPNGVTSLRSSGPYGPYATFGIRWNFGG